MSKNKLFSEDEKLNLVIKYYESGKSKNAFSKLSGISPQVLPIGENDLKNIQILYL